MANNDVISTKIPLFPLNTVLFPHTSLPLHIFEKKYRIMLRDVIKDESEIGIILQSGRTIEEIGCLASVEMVLKEYEDGRSDIVTLGRERFEVVTLHSSKPYLEATIKKIRDETFDPNDDELDILALNTLQLLSRYLQKSDTGRLNSELKRMNARKLSFVLSSLNLFSLTEKQELLETSTVKTRLTKIGRLIDDQISKIQALENLKEIPGLEEHPRNLFN